MRPLRILLADDHELIRRGVRVTLTEVKGWEICAEAINGREAVKKALESKPDLVIMDIAMPELNGLEAAGQIHKALPRAEILILTMHDSEELLRATLAAGARGYMLKSDVDRIIIQAVEALCQHKPFFSTAVSALVLEGYLHPSSAGKQGPEGGRLSPREREIIQLVAEGKGNKEVADILGISVKTAEAHRTNIMRKLNLHSAVDLVRYAIRNKIIQA